MSIDWIWGLVGGVMIGTAAAVLLLGTGRIMGASGIVGGLIDGTGQDRSTTFAFLIGLIGMPALMTLGGWAADTHATSLPWLLIIGGLCVGIGTRFANGCTSGHGVCGMSRLSVRGFVATLAYIGAGAATVTLARVGLGL
ncbi:YeeE/YedE thiosulfate transporter family protein [uncultured Tateyamaria sp.]|uniref:YeeE/YedE family protein n=1 Tax=uncultured Tateyamaria sp. TaxID=455651 RepID=UPI0026033890|nr:YeeE/YedE thiosulfate transporter family protein [uncultured Tateyamaria sp.]